MHDTYSIQLQFRQSQAEEAFSKFILRDGRFTLAPSDAAPCGLVIVEIERQTAVQTIQQLAASPEVQEIFVLAREKDPDLILEAMRAGATEFLPLPLRGQEFADALNRFVDRRMFASAKQANSNSTAAPALPRTEPSREQGRIITMLGGKHGIGTTTLAVNLAVSCAKAYTAKTSAPQQTSSSFAALIDTRRPQGEVPLFLDLDYTYTWAEATRDSKRLDSQFVRSLMVRHTSGLDVLAAPGHDEQPESSAPQAMGALLSVVKQMYPLTVLDCGPYLDDTCLTMLQASDTILLVTELSLPSLGEARRLMDTLESINPALLDIVRLVVNKDTADGGISIPEAEELLGSQVVWRIKDDYPAVVTAINQGLPLSEASPRSPVTQAIRQMAESFTASSDAAPAGVLKKLFSGLAPTRKAKKTAPSVDAGQHTRVAPILPPNLSSAEGELA